MLTSVIRALLVCSFPSSFTHFMKGQSHSGGTDTRTGDLSCSGGFLRGTDTVQSSPPATNLTFQRKMALLFLFFLIWKCSVEGWQASFSQTGQPNPVFSLQISSSSITSAEPQGHAAADAKFNLKNISLVNPWPLNTWRLLLASDGARSSHNLLNDLDVQP